MLELDLRLPVDKPVSVLVLGAHADDIEIGCGGTILRLAQRHPLASFVWVVLSANKHRAREAMRGYESFLATVEDKIIRVEQFRDGFFPYDGARIKECFEQIKGDCSPQLILTHYLHDRHQDHRLVSDLTWNTFRNHLILEYEIPKYDGDLGSPNFFVGLKREISQKKIDYLLDCFESQCTKQWFTSETFLGLMRLRGMECNAEDGYAEAFYCRKMKW